MNRGERGTQQVPNDKHRNMFLGISRIMSLQDLLGSDIVAASPGLHVVGDSLLYKLEDSVVFNTVVRKGGGLPQESKGEQGTVNSVKIKSCTSCTLGASLHDLNNRFLGVSHIALPVHTHKFIKHFKERGNQIT